MWGSPLGYGSISSTYELDGWEPARAEPARGSAPASLETSHVRSRAHTPCQRGSISLGSYRCSAIGNRRLAVGCAITVARGVPARLRQVKRERERRAWTICWGALTGD